MKNATISTISRETEVEIKDLPGQEYLGTRFTAALGSIGPEVVAAFTTLYGRLQDSGSVATGPPFLIAAPPEQGRLQVEVGAPCSPVPEPAPGQHRGRLLPGKAAVTRHRGPYDQIGGVYTALFEWAARTGHRPAGNPREVYLNSPDEVASPADFLTEVILPIS